MCFFLWIRISLSSFSLLCLLFSSISPCHAATNQHFERRKHREASVVVAVAGTGERIAIASWLMVIMTNTNPQLQLCVFEVLALLSVQ